MFASGNQKSFKLKEEENSHAKLINYADDVAL